VSDVGTEQPLQFLKSTDSVVRNSALGAATSLVDYRSAGHCLVIGAARDASSLAELLTPLTVTVLEIDAALTRPVKQLSAEGIHVYRSARPTLRGYLGAFALTVQGDGREYDLAVMRLTDSGFFDLVLDLSPEPLHPARLPPLGYRHATTDEAMRDAVAELTELRGEFDKPRYFDYNSDVCAHSRSKLGGCSQCIDICATGAIQSVGELIEVDPYLCQGCGTCATVCPSGAMAYAWPRVGDAIERTRLMREKHPVTATTLLLYRQGVEDEDNRLESHLPAQVLPVAVEEVSAFGIDYWAAMVSSGFTHIVVLIPESDNDSSADLQALQAQAAVFHSIVVALGMPADTVRFLSQPDVDQLAALAHQLQQLPVEARDAQAQFASHNNKRQTFRMAIDQLIRLQPPAQESVDLPVGSPFGRVDVNTERCTLCMACVSVCPAGALLDSQDEPRLRFIEANCVQCGICAQGCPESAITLRPQYRFDSVAARTSETLNREEPFHCVSCHKPFATRKMIDNMTTKLASHWMFGDDKAVRRLKMCEDCRVIDIFTADAKGIKVHRDD